MGKFGKRMAYPLEGLLLRIARGHHWTGRR